MGWVLDYKEIGRKTRYIVKRWVETNLALRYNYKGIENSLNVVVTFLIGINMHKKQKQEPMNT